MTLTFAISLASSEQAVVRVYHPDHQIGRQHQHKADHRLEHTGRRGHTHVVQLQQGPVNVGVDGLGGTAQKALAQGHLVEEAEVRVKDAADGHEEHQDDHGAKHGQGDIADLLELGGPVQPGRLIKAFVNAADTGHVDDGALPGALPEVDNGENNGPVFGGGVPVDGIVLEDGGVQVAVCLAQEGVHDKGQDDRRYHGGKTDDRLDHLGRLAGGDLGHTDGDKYRDDQPKQDPHHIVEDGVADHDEGVLGFEQVFKVIKGAPGALENADREVDLLEGDEDAEHGKVVVGDKVDKAGQHHKVEGKVLFQGGLPLAVPLVSRQQAVKFRRWLRWGFCCHRVPSLYDFSLIIPPARGVPH